MCNLCGVVTIPLDFLVNLLMLAVSYLILISQMGIMFLARFLEYNIRKFTSKP
jgi:hypothetical protein